MSKNKNIKQSKPKISLKTDHSKPAINQNKNEVSRNIQIDTSSKSNKSPEGSNIKFDTYQFLIFPSNYFLILLVYFSLLPLFNIVSAINIHNSFITDYNNSSTMKSYAAMMNALIDDIKSDGNEMGYKPIKIEYDLSSSNGSIDFNDNQMVLFNDKIYKEIQAGSRKIKSQLSKPLTKSAYVDGKLIYIRSDNLPISIPYTIVPEKNPIFKGRSFIRISFRDDESVSFKKPQGLFYKNSILKSIIESSDLDLGNRIIRRIEILTEDGMYHSESYYSSSLLYTIGYYDINDLPLKNGKIQTIRSAVYNSNGKLIVRVKNKKEEAVLYPNIFRGFVLPFPSFILTAQKYYEGSRTERVLEFVTKDFEKLMARNKEGWNNSSTKKILDEINIIDIN